VGTRPATCHVLQKSAVRVTVQEMLGTSSTAGTLAIGSRTVAETGIVLSTNTVTRGTMTSISLTVTSPPDNALRRVAETKEESKFSAVI
jgi:hypothetical protein